jgi:uncharacterized cupin superfamily protein
MTAWAVVERWDSHPLDLKDPQGRFRRSEWNYFLVDSPAGVLMGYWLAEAGHEDLGQEDFDEILHVISGRLYVTCDGQDQVAGPGDTVVVKPGRPLRIAVREPTRAFFVCYRMADPAGYEAMVRQAMAAKGL